jgi:hypothetical protein
MNRYDAPYHGKQPPWYSQRPFDYQPFGNASVLHLHVRNRYPHTTAEFWPPTPFQYRLSKQYPRSKPAARHLMASVACPAFPPIPGLIRNTPGFRNTWVIRIRVGNPFHTAANQLKTVTAALTLAAHYLTVISKPSQHPGNRSPG